MVDKMTARNEAHVLRLAMIYSALDAKAVIEPFHIEAAIAFVDYCTRSVQWLFSETTGDKAADLLLWALRNEPSGMSRSQISDTVFHRNYSKARINQIITTLKEWGYVNVFETGRNHPNGKKEEIWYAIEHKETACNKVVITL
jgi:hypothetical protein